jgi:hypothetical protein
MQCSLLLLTSNICNSLSFLIVYTYIFSKTVASGASIFPFFLITLKSWECSERSHASFNYNNYQVIEKCKYLCSGSSPSWSGRWLAGRNLVRVLPKSALIYITQFHHSSLSENKTPRRKRYHLIMLIYLQPINLVQPKFLPREVKNFIQYLCFYSQNKRFKNFLTFQ